MNSGFHTIKNTTKAYACTNCTSNDVSVIREDPKGIDPRIKCNTCNFTFSGKDSLAAVEAGIIQPSSAEALADASEPEVEQITPRVQTKAVNEPINWSEPIYASPVSAPSIPARPAFVFIDTKTGLSEFSTKRDFKKTAIKWAQVVSNYNVYELKPVKLTVDVKVV